MEEEKFEDNMPFPWESEDQFSKRYNDAYSIVHNVSNYSIHPWDNPFRWQNNKEGMIVGTTFNDELRFVPERLSSAYEEYELMRCPDLFRYTHYDSYLYCDVVDELCAADFPVVARGFVGYLLPRMSYSNFDSEIAYEEYFIKRWEIFLASQKRKPRHKRIPQSEYMNQFISEERNLINDSEDVYEYLTQIDIDNIKEYIADFMAYISDRLTANKMTACVEENKTESISQKKQKSQPTRSNKSNAPQNNSQVENSRDESKFREYIPDTFDKDEIMEKLHILLDGTYGAEVVKVLRAAECLGYLKKLPTFKPLIAAFSCLSSNSKVETQRKNYGTYKDTTYPKSTLQPYIDKLKL